MSRPVSSFEANLPKRQSREDSTPKYPPLDAAPVLRYLNSRTDRVSADHQIETTVDDRGVVDVYATVRCAMELVDEHYVWPRKGWRPADIHHFVWERCKYLPQNWDGDQVPNQYREIPYHKGYLPRQLHNFMHAVVAPPPIPDMEVMRQRVTSYQLARQLFDSARMAVIVSRRPEKLGGVSRNANGDLSIEQDILDMITSVMHDKFEASRASASSGNEFINMDDGELLGSTAPEVAMKLGRVAAHSGLNLMPFIYGNRSAA